MVVAMRSTRSGLASLLFVVLAAVAPGVDGTIVSMRGLSSHAVDLDGDTFDTTVGREKPAVVLFYAPWCVHSQRLLREYELVASTFRNQKQHPTDPNFQGVVVARVDLDTNKGLARKFDVRGFPTVRFFRRGLSAQREVAAASGGSGALASLQGDSYGGSRTAEGLVDFVNEKTGLEVRLKQLASWVRSLNPNTFDAVALDPTKDVLVNFVAPWSIRCKDFASTWETVAETYRSDTDAVTIASINADKYRDLAHAHDVTSYPTILYFPRVDDGSEPSSSSSGTADSERDGGPTNAAEVFGRVYNGGINSQDFIIFINNVAGLHRIVGGAIHAEAGRNATLDGIAGDLVQMLRDGHGDEAAVKLGHLKAAGSDVCQPGGHGNAVFASSSLQSNTKCQGALAYVLFGEKVLEASRGLQWIDAEYERLGQLIASDAVNHAHRTRFMVKRNVLAAFRDA